MSIVNPISEQRVVIDQVPWETYVSLAEATDGRRGRICYDQGTMEIMSPSKLHENIGCLIGRMVEAYTEELQIEIVSVASMTVKLEKYQRGFEADEAYYIQRAELVRGKEILDFSIDPAPDLAIEIDISRSAMSKEPIFAAFEVPEYWSCDSDGLNVFVFHGNGYHPANESSVLPGFPFDLAVAVIKQRQTTGETKLIRQFRDSVRATLGAD